MLTVAYYPLFYQKNAKNKGESAQALTYYNT